MGKINGCLKGVFIAFKFVFTVLGIVIVLQLSEFSYQYQKGNMEMDGETIFWGWVVAIAMIGISALGSHAACTENKCCLKAFAVFMVIGMVIMLICGVFAIVYKIQVKQSSEYARIRNNEFYNIYIGICFGFSFIAMMGLIIAVNMINQINRHDSDGVPAFAMRAY